MAVMMKEQQEKPKQSDLPQETPNPVVPPPISAASDNSEHRDPVPPSPGASDVKGKAWPKPTVWFPLALAASLGLTGGVYIVWRHGTSEVQQGPSSPAWVGRRVWLVSNVHLGVPVAPVLVSGDKVVLPLSSAIEIELATGVDSVATTSKVAVVFQPDEPGVPVILRTAFSPDAVQSVKKGEPWTESLIHDADASPTGGYVTVSAAAVTVVLPAAALRAIPDQGTVYVWLTAETVDETTIGRWLDRAKSPVDPSDSPTRTMAPLHLEFVKK